MNKTFISCCVLYDIQGEIVILRIHVLGSVLLHTQSTSITVDNQRSVYATLKCPRIKMRILYSITEVYDFSFTFSLSLKQRGCVVLLLNFRSNFRCRSQPLNHEI